MIRLEDSFIAAREITRKHAKSFYFASLALNRELRMVCYAIYAFCRCADDAVDLAQSDAEVEEGIKTYRRYIDALEKQSKGYEELPAWWWAWAETVNRYQIPKDYFYELLEGLAMDQGKVRLENGDMLRLYCYRVASVVGLMLTHIYVERPSDDLLSYAAALGRAMQLTNILRDVEEDWERGRLYLPLSELKGWGIDEAVFAKKQMTVELRRYIKAKVEEARGYYREAEEGIRRLPASGRRLAVWVMRYVYAEILEEIVKRDYDLFCGRAKVGLARKLILACRAWRAHRG
jgi:phytoene synthase